MPTFNRDGDARKSQGSLAHSAEIAGHANWRTGPTDRSVREAANSLRRRDSTTTYRSLWPDGTVRWLGSKGRALHDADGTLLRVTGTTMDITERKEAEEALRASEERARNGSAAVADVPEIVDDLRSCVATQLVVRRETSYRSARPGESASWR